MEKHKAVKVRVVRVELTRLVEGVVVLYEGGDLEGVGEAVLDDGAEGVGWCAFRERELVFTVSHRFWTDEDEVEGDAGEEVGELDPDLSW